MREIETLIRICRLYVDIETCRELLGKVGASDVMNHLGGVSGRSLDLVRDAVARTQMGLAQDKLYAEAGARAAARIDEAHSFEVLMRNPMAMRDAVAETAKDFTAVLAAAKSEPADDRSTALTDKPSGGVR